jgi:hypothetical protein
VTSAYPSARKPGTVSVYGFINNLIANTHKLKLLCVVDEYS